MKSKSRMIAGETIAEEFARRSKAPPTPKQMHDNIRQRITSAEKIAALKATRPEPVTGRKRKAR